MPDATRRFSPEAMILLAEILVFIFQPPCAMLWRSGWLSQHLHGIWKPESNTHNICHAIKHLTLGKFYDSGNIRSCTVYCASETHAGNLAHY